LTPTWQAPQDAAAAAQARQSTQRAAGGSADQQKPTPAAVKPEGSPLAEPPSLQDQQQQHEQKRKQKPAAVKVTKTKALTLIVRKQQASGKPVADAFLEDASPPPAAAAADAGNVSTPADNKATPAKMMLQGLQQQQQLFQQQLSQQQQVSQQQFAPLPIDAGRILSGADTRTTVMLMGLPKHWTQQMLLQVRAVASWLV
jgi:hypothetical protein